MSPIAKGLGLLFGLPIVLAIVFFTYFNATGEERMKSVCSQIAPGMTQARLNEFIREKRLSGRSVAGGISFIGDSMSYGRHACKVTMLAGVVKAAEYSFAD